MNRNQENAEHNYIQSVWLSFVPVTIIYLLYTLTSLLFNSSGSIMFLLFTIFLFITVNTISFSILSSIMLFRIYWRSCLLTNLFLIGFIFSIQLKSPCLVTFGYYMMILSFFHLSEFVFTALYNHKQVTTDSFLINHSKEYNLAAVASWLEFFIESFIFPGLKTNLYFRFVGLSMCLFGETFRKLAMYTAGKNFNHYVQEVKQNDHILVRNGVYSLVRHPSYFGWFYWSIGTQVLLANPICICLYTFASWKFFKSRIIFEEYYLYKFFGLEYKKYQKRVPTGIPFVSGFIQYDESLD